MKCASPSSVSSTTKSSLQRGLHATEDEQIANHNYAPSVSGEIANSENWSGQTYPTDPDMMEMPTDLDFQLMWPDSEDLFQSIMSSDNNTQQMPLGTLPFPQTVDQFTPTSLDSPSSFDDRGSAIKAIPSSGGHQAVYGVSKMISNLVSTC